MRSRLLPILLLAACARTTMKTSATERHGGVDAMAEMDFWDALTASKAVTNDEALHALLLGFGGAGAADHAARVAEARKREWISRKRDLPANETAAVGWIARAVCREAGIRGGVTMRLFGTGERYAVNELNHKGWLPRMSPNQSLSGMQLIALLSAVEDSQ